MQKQSKEAAMSSGMQTIEPSTSSAMSMAQSTTASAMSMTQASTASAMSMAQANTASALSIAQASTASALPIAQVSGTTGALSMHVASTSDTLQILQPSTSSAQSNLAPDNASQYYRSSSDSDEDSATPEVNPTASTSSRTNFKRNPSAAELISWWRPSLLQARLGTREQCIQFAVERGLLAEGKMCTIHRKPMVLGNWGTSLGVYRCRKSNCRQKSISRAKGTFFENSKIDIVTIFQLMYYFCHPRPYYQVQLETIPLDGQTCLSRRTICDWFNYCRECVVKYELENSTYDTKIGGPNKVVQIDESKFGKRKYNRGRRIEGHWVIGMIEDRSEDLRLEMCPDNERSSEVLVPLIQKHVAEGSIIHTDYWRAYDCLPEHGYVHKKVNHSDPTNKFVAPDGTHTQRIESQWRVLKQAFHNDPCRGSNFAEWLVLYNWRRKIRLSYKDPYEELLKAVKYVYPAP